METAPVIDPAKLRDFELPTNGAIFGTSRCSETMPCTTLRS